VEWTGGDGDEQFFPESEWSRVHGVALRVIEDAQCAHAGRRCSWKLVDTTRVDGEHTIGW
jgi:hypothetical protein